MTTPQTFFFAGGGTGGHLYPGLAVAEALREQAPACEIHFLASTRPVDAQILDPTDFEFTALPGQGLSRAPRHWWGFLRGWQRASAQAGRLLDTARNPVVIGTGGFVAGPVCWAARRRGVPIALINVDTVAGKANRLAARWARDIFLQFAEAAPALGRWGARLHTVGCPLRAAFAHPDPERGRRDLDLDPDRHVLLVTGASSGARHVNEAVRALFGDLAPFADTWQLVHLTGTRDHAAVRTVYKETPPPLSHRVIAYHHAMADLLAAADLVIGRSGAVSVAEYAAAGVPALCLPYPFHRDRHQWRNAEVLVRAGAAVLVEDVPDLEERAAGLRRALIPLLADAGRRRDMAAACARVGRPEAARSIAATLLEDRPIGGSGGISECP